MDKSQWRVLTKRGPWEKEMATHSSTLDLENAKAKTYDARI